MVGVLTPHQTLTEWRTVFYVSCGFLVFTNLQYVIFASGKTQPWNTPAEHNVIENGIEGKDTENEKSEKLRKDEKL